MDAPFTSFARANTMNQSTSSTNGALSHGPTPGTLPQKYQNLLYLGATFSLLAFALCLASLQYLLRMKRVFRQDLVLMLIITDTFKSVAYFLVPIVTWVGVNMRGESKYCQFSGWVMTFTVEATDYLILLIPIQTVLSILSPQGKPGKGGLARHRTTILVGWICIPTIAATIPFTNPHGAYISCITFCYLPTEPIWYRLVLAWIPRCLIFILILATYTAINIYVHIKFKGFGDQHNEGNLDLVSDRTLSFSHVVNRRNSSIASAMTTQTLSSDLHDGNQAPEREPHRDQSSYDVPKFLTPNYTPRNLSVDRRKSAAGSTGDQERSLSISFDSSILDTTPADRTTSISTADSDSRSRFRRRRRKELSEIDRTRIAIKRQLRFLFIYPILFLLSWIPAAVAYFLEYDPKYKNFEPYWVLILLNISLPFQGGLDALVFLIREKPWKLKLKPLPGWRSNNNIRPRERKESSIDPLSPAESRSIHWWEKEGADEDV